MMTNHIFEHQNVYFDAMFLYVNNTFLSPIMHIFRIIVDKYFYSSKTGLLVRWPSRGHI